jgi:hypothetical protein
MNMIVQIWFCQQEEDEETQEAITSGIKNNQLS